MAPTFCYRNHVHSHEASADACDAGDTYGIVPVVSVEIDMGIRLAECCKCNRVGVVMSSLLDIVSPDGKEYTSHPLCDECDPD